MRVENASTHKMNKYGEMEFLCLNPLKGLNSLMDDPFVKTEKETVVTHLNQIATSRGHPCQVRYSPQRSTPPYHMPSKHLTLRPYTHSYLVALCSI